MPVLLPTYGGFENYKKPLLSSFRDSLEKARAYRLPESVEQRAQYNATELVNAAAFGEYNAELSRLHALAELLATHPTKPSKPAPTNPTASNDGQQPTVFGPFTICDLVSSLSSNLKISSADAGAIVEITFAAVVSAIEKGKRVDIRGFGAFSARPRREWKGRNPRTLEMFEVAAERVGHFKASKGLVTLVSNALMAGASYQQT